MSTWSCSGSLASFLEISKIISEHQCTSYSCDVKNELLTPLFLYFSFVCSVWHLSQCDEACYKCKYDQTREKRAEWFIMQWNNSISPSKKEKITRRCQMSAFWWSESTLWTFTVDETEMRHLPICTISKVVFSCFNTGNFQSQVVASNMYIVQLLEAFS